MENPIPPSLKPAFEKCQTLAQSHYENFPVASLLLPKSARPHVAALYAFARTADDFADEEKFAGRRLRLLAQWEKDFQKALAGKTAPAELTAFAFTVKAFRIPERLPLALLKAFRRDAAFHPFSNWNQALYYCAHSANPVGRMVLLISGIRDEKLHRFSDFICTGLQLINFWQDSSLDLGRGRIYYPFSELKKAGVSRQDLLARKDSMRVRKLVQGAVDYTESYFRRGFPLLSQTQGRLRLELKATCLGGLGILHQIRRMDYNMTYQRPSWSAWDKLSLGFRALFGPTPS